MGCYLPRHFCPIPSGSCHPKCWVCWRASRGEERGEVRPLSPSLPFPASSDRDLRCYWVKVKGLPPRAGKASGGSDGSGQISKLPLPEALCGHTAWECCGCHGLCPPPRLNPFIVFHHTVCSTIQYVPPYSVFHHTVCSTIQCVPPYSVFRHCHCYDFTVP